MNTTLVPLGPADGRAAWTVEGAGRTLAVFVVSGRQVVTDARCPHRGGPLVEGWVRDGQLVCPSHWYRFDLHTGRCETDPRLTLGCYPVVEHLGEPHAVVPVAVPARSWSQILRAHARGES